MIPEQNLEDAIFYLYLTCIYVCVLVCMYMACIVGARRGRKRASDSAQLELQAVVSYSVWVVVTKP